MADNDSRAGQRYATPDLMDWCARTHAPHDEALQLAFDSPQRHDIPAIQVSRSEGRMLELLMRMIGAQRVVEVGTLVGYSAIHLGRGLAPGGKLWSLEYDERHATVARENLAAAGLAGTVEVLVGAGRELLPTLEPHAPFDAVFVDADKANYDHYGAWAAANLRPGGLLIGDNSYLFGRLLEDSDEAAAMRRFHEQAAEQFYSTTIPTPDGTVVAIKK